MNNSVMSMSGLAMLSFTLAGLPMAAKAEPAGKPGDKTWTAPKSASRKKNPLPADAATVAAGLKLFQANCVACHGPKGDGDGPAAAALDKKPGVLSDPKMWKQADGALFWKITEGNTPMPQFRDALTADQKWQLIRYVRTLSVRPAEEVAAAPVQSGVGAAGGKAAGNPDAAPRLSVGKGGNGATEAGQSVPTSQTAKWAELEKDNLRLREDVQGLKTEAQQARDSAAAQAQETREALDDLERDLTATKKMAKDAYPGSTKMLIGGYGTAAYHPIPDHAGNFHNYFTAAFNPLMLWKISDRILFEGEIELELDGTKTTLNLEVAQVSYLLNDYMTLGAGRFLNPSNFFVERQHMGWVNRLPDKPLAVYDGLLPESMLGMQVRGGIPAGRMRIEYAAFVANPPTLNTTDSAAYGHVEFDDLNNRNDHMSFGGRVGILPVHSVEIGYGVQYSAIWPDSLPANMLLQSVDFNHTMESPAIKGLVNLRAQWVWQQVDRKVYDPAGTLGFGPKDFKNNRDGGYVSLSYRPQRLKNEVIRNLEGVARFDLFNQRQTPVGYDEWRYAFGLDYWIYQNEVVKLAYEIDRQNGVGHDGKSVHGEFITGF